jgi:hypothetical protein
MLQNDRNIQNMVVQPLQGKYPLAEAIKEVFSVIKLEKIVKKTSATTFVCGNKYFYGGSNGTSTHLKNMGGRKF